MAINKKVVCTLVLALGVAVAFSFVLSNGKKKAPMAAPATDDVVPGEGVPTASLGKSASSSLGKARYEKGRTVFNKPKKGKQSSLGTPFSFMEDKEQEKLGGRSFPFKKSKKDAKAPVSDEEEGAGEKLKDVFKSGKKEKKSPSKGSSKAKTALNADDDSGVSGAKFLGAAVSPGAMNKGKDEMKKTTKRIPEVDAVSNNTGGNLNIGFR